MTQKPYSEACERNAPPILEVLNSILPKEPVRLLEIGSGSGQHACLLAPELPQVTWVTSDVVSNHEGIQAWITDTAAPNIQGPIALEIGVDPVRAQNFDFVFIANVFHIMSWDLAKVLFKDLRETLEKGSQLLVYGPFNYGGDFTSDSNRQFNQYLLHKFPLGGIRHFEELEKLAALNGLELVQDFAMPSNNRFLQFQKM